MRKLKHVGAVALKSTRGKRGITLVALIITIIVMLILVGVSVQVVINSDLIGTAQDAANRTKIAYEEEGNTGEIIVGDKTYESIDDYLAGKEKLGQVTAGQRATSNSEYSDGTDTAVIPAGFTVSGVKTSTVDETTIDGGLVIYLIPEGTTVDWTDGTAVANLQQTYDQFVWIPIPRENINEMYMCQSEGGTKSCNITVQEVEGEKVAYCTTHSSTLMAGRLYATSSGENYNAELTSQTYTSGSGLREPDTVSGYDGSTENLAQLNGILSTSYASESDLKTDLQSEYNEIVKSVYENKGFYIGRYETSGMIDSNTNVSIKVVAGSDNSTNSNISYVTWYRMYAQQKKYAENKSISTSVGSSMIQGAAYDQVMKFVDTDSYDVTTAENVGHVKSDFTAVPYQTGGLNYSTVYTGTVEYNDISKNVYDLEGNVKAWTTEAPGTNKRVGRGGYYNGSTSASSRSNSDPVNSNNNFGSVCQLYVK